MKVNKFARLALIAGLAASGTTAGGGVTAQAAKAWTQSDKVCKAQTAGTICLEQRTSTTTGERQSRMVLTPEQGQWIRPDVHATFGWDFGTEDGACGQEACAKATEPVTGAWIPQGDEIRGLGYSTPQGDFDIYMGETKQQVIKSSGWKAEDPGRASAQLLVKVKDNKTYYTGRLRLKSIDLMSIQPRTLKIELLNKGEVKAAASTTYKGETEEVDWSSDVTKAIRMPSKGFEAIRVTGTYETSYGKKDSVTTTYTHGR